MNDITMIDDTVLNDKTIVQKTKKPLVPITLFLMGAAIIFAAYSPVVKANMNLCIGLLIVGFTFIVIGVVKLVRPQKMFFYQPTGERLRRKVYFFNPGDKVTILDTVHGGHFDKLPQMSINNRTSLMTIIYCTDKKSCTMAQVLEYVPFQYTPVRPAVVFKDAQ